MGTPTQRRRLTGPERRRAILAAAMDVFGARGYHGTTLDDVARAAGVSKALIYEHFASKQALHRSLWDDHVGELLRRLEENGRAGRAGARRLRGGLDAFFSFVEEHRGAWRMLFRDAADPEMADVQARAREQAANVITALMAADPGGEAFGEREREMHAQLLIGAAQALANWWLDHADVPRAAVVDRAMEFSWLGLERLRAGERAYTVAD